MAKEKKVPNSNPNAQKEEKNGNGSNPRKNGNNHRGTQKPPRGDRQKPAADKPNSEQNNSPVSGFTSTFDWYSKYPELLQSTAQVAFPNRPGMRIPFAANGTKDLKIPGICSITWVPSIGQSTKVDDPASTAAKEIYARVRSKYSSSLEADAPDFMNYLLALDSIFAYIAYLKRICRTVNAWTPNNRLLPQTLLRSYGLSDTDIEAWRENYTSAIGYVNQLVYQTRDWMCPDVFPLFKRHVWMSGNVFSDAPSVNAQMYTFVPAAFYKFALEEGDQPKGMLKMEKLPWYASSNNAFGPAEAFAYGRSLLQALAEADDTNYTINGYLQRAFEDSPVFATDLITGEEVVDCVYDEMVLMQIENLRATHGIVKVSDEELATNNITQDVAQNLVLCTPTWLTSFSGTFPLSPTLNIGSDSPGIIDVVEATRMQVNIGGGGEVYCATEIPLSITLHGCVGSDSDIAIHQYTSLNAISEKVSYATTASMLLFETFDWHPAMVLSLPTAASGYGTVFGYDIKNFTQFDQNTLNRIHEVCLFSEFNAFNLIN